ncbi:MAG: MoaD/ThiS family protein [Clostridium sp.]|nr:MoaD/ThiS family protein [Clostridium sp.]
MVKIKYFGILKPCMPQTEEDGYWHADKAGTAIGQILDETEVTGKAENMVILVNKVRKPTDYVLQDGDTMTVMPLLAGG